MLYFLLRNKSLPVFVLYVSIGEAFRNSFQIRIRIQYIFFSNSKTQIKRIQKVKTNYSKQQNCQKLIDGDAALYGTISIDNDKNNTAMNQVTFCWVIVSQNFLMIWVLRHSKFQQLNAGTSQMLSYYHPKKSTYNLTLLNTLLYCSFIELVKLKTIMTLIE